jgi:hypothetical protein
MFSSNYCIGYYKRNQPAMISFLLSLNSLPLARELKQQCGPLSQNSFMI